MPHFWFRDAEGERIARALPAASHDLRALFPPGAAGTSADPIVKGPAASVVAFGAGSALRWVVIAGHAAAVRVNGIPLDPIGVRVLAHKDELSLPGVGSAYFSAENLAEVVQFPGADRPVLCGRCRQAISAGAPAVKCPGCGTWYDESAQLPCFSYQPICAFCPQSTSLDAGFTWIPDEED